MERRRSARSKFLYSLRSCTRIFKCFTLSADVLTGSAVTPFSGGEALHDEELCVQSVSLPAKISWLSDNLFTHKLLTSLKPLYHTVAALCYVALCVYTASLWIQIRCFQLHMLKLCSLHSVSLAIVLLACVLRACSSVLHRSVLQRNTLIACETLLSHLCGRAFLDLRQVSLNPLRCKCVTAGVELPRHAAVLYGE